MSTSASPSPLVMNGRSRSQNNSSPFPPTGSGTDSAAQSEHGSSSVHQGAPSTQTSEYAGAGPSSGLVNGYAKYAYFFISSKSFRVLVGADSSDRLLI